MPLIRADDPYVEEISYGTQSGVYRSSPWNNKTFNSAVLILDPGLAQYLNEAGEIPEPLRQAFRENGVALSQHAVVSSTEPGNHWMIRDDESERVFSVWQANTGLDVYAEYDPVTRPWYVNAVGRDGVAWTKYAAWGGGSLYSKSIRRWRVR